MYLVFIKADGVNYRVCHTLREAIEIVQEGNGGYIVKAVDLEEAKNV